MVAAPADAHLTVVAHPDTMTANDPTAARWTMAFDRRSAARIAALAIVVPLVVYVALAPDWYYIQNGIDPFFYTGYVQNFQNMFHAVGDRHYFVSRWTIYMPQRVLLAITGDPKTAFLIMRLVGAAIIAGSIAWFGRRRWSLATTTSIIVLSLAMPMTIRAVLTDYSDAVVTPVGVITIIALAARPDLRRSALLAGVAAGIVVVANPFGITVIFAAVPFWLARVDRRRWLMLVAIAAAGGTAVLVAGWALFRVRYGLPNVYRPTIEFIQNNSAVRDPLKSPRLWWLGYRLWIYVPLMVLGAAVCLEKFAGVRFDAVERAILKTCALQYAFQIWFQFSRHSSTLEISYYWSYIMPSLLCAFAVVVAAAFRGARPWVLPITTAGIVVALRAAGAPSPEVFQSWIDLVVVVGFVAWAARRWFGRHPGALSAAMVAVVFAVQFGAPRPEPILPGEMRVLSSYELLFAEDSSDGVESFEAVTWFVEQMDTLPEQMVRSAVFWFDEPVGSRMAAMFGSHVSGRSLNAPGAPAPADEPLDPGIVTVLQNGQLPTIILMGPAADVDAFGAMLVEALPTLEVAYEGTSPDRSGTLVRVLTTLEV